MTEKHKALGTLLLGISIIASTCYAGPFILMESIKNGDIITGPIKIGRRIITLPSGNWQVYQRSENNPSSDGTSQMPSIIHLNLQEIIDNRIDRTLQIDATTYSVKVNWIEEPCKNKGDSYLIDDKKRGINDQFCVRVGYTHDFLDGARGDTFLTWARDTKIRGISYSPEMPFIQVTRYTSADYLRMSIRFNPATSGIAASKEKPRQFNEWNPTTLAKYPQHLKFYQALQNWAPMFAASVTNI